eukprot:scaffold26075_cov69-Phaeocystis_antarctica.AAC.4
MLHCPRHQPVTAESALRRRNMFGPHARPIPRRLCALPPLSSWAVGRCDLAHAILWDWAVPGGAGSGPSSAADAGACRSFGGSVVALHLALDLPPTEGWTRGRLARLQSAVPGQAIAAPESQPPRSRPSLRLRLRCRRPHHHWLHRRSTCRRRTGGRNSFSCRKGGVSQIYGLLLFQQRGQSRLTNPGGVRLLPVGFVNFSSSTRATLSSSASLQWSPISCMDHGSWVSSSCPTGTAIAGSPSRLAKKMCRISFRTSAALYSPVSSAPGGILGARIPVVGPTIAVSRSLAKSSFVT